MPSLTSAQLATLYTQPGQAWSSLGITGLSAAADAVHIARRVDSSGTQKTFEALIAGTPNGQGGQKDCNTGTDSFALPDSGNTTTGDNESVCSSGATTVFAGSGGGNVRNCLNNLNTNGFSGIGILTTEDKAGSNGWRFVKVDGVTPNQAQTAAGRYRFYTETSVNTRAGGAFATNSAQGYSTFVSRFLTDFANPTIINQINGTAQTYGAAGLMALLSRQAPGTSPDFTGATPVVPWTKISGTNVNNCQKPKLFN